MAEVLRKAAEGRTTPLLEGKLGNNPKVRVDEEKVLYIPIQEVNFDDNGLKDPAFAMVLSALAT